MIRQGLVFPGASAQPRVGASDAQHLSRKNNFKPKTFGYSSLPWVRSLGFDNLLPPKSQLGRFFNPARN
jgi:hypothetical protein